MRSQIHHVIADAARQWPSSPALTSKDETLSYHDLWEGVQVTGAGLAALGLQAQDRVALFIEKRFEMVVGSFGAVAAGGVFVPVNPGLRPRQVAHIVQNSGAAVLVTTSARLTSIAAVLNRCPSLRHVVVVDALSSRPPAESRHYEITTWDELVGGSAGELPSGIDLDPAAILYTSGSTGSPKGVVVSHRNLIVGGESVSEYLENCHDDVILSVLPLSFDAGLSQLTTGFAVGAHVVLHNYVLPRDVVQLCTQHRVTGLTGVPPLWGQLIELAWPESATRSLRYVANTGGRMPKTTLDRIRTTFPKAKPYLMYGLTEAFRSTYLDPSEVDARPDSIGKAIPNAEIHVVRPDGSPCEAGEPGELVHRGALVALGYWNDPERTAERFRPLPRTNGIVIEELCVWSGDTVVRDEDGFLYFVAREDEMIKTSGYRVSPTEVEEAAYESAVVRDAVAYGIDDHILGQRICLVVSVRGPEPNAIHALRATLRTSLPLYMVPHEIVTLDDLPRSPNGKLDRTAIRSAAGR